jgi:anti-sigma regulatory factor (Ser/Thr protein kinase)
MAHSASEAATALEAIDERELVITVEKILQRDIFGLTKYLPEFGVEISVCHVESVAERNDVVDGVQDYVESLGAGHRLASTVSTIADELLSNAMYHGKNADKNPRMYFGSDGHWFAMSVVDYRGSLRPEHIRSALRRFRNPNDPLLPALGDSGLGLYTALASCSQLVFNIDPGIRTEVIAIVDLTGRMRGVRTGGHSLHLFMNKPRVEAVPQAIIPPRNSQRVMLSDSLRIDLRSQLAKVQRTSMIPLVRPKPPTRPSRSRVNRNSAPDPLHESLGLDTARGLLRGARTRAIALETALRFLTTDYESAVAYRVTQSALVPFLAAGRVNNWWGLEPVTFSEPSSLANCATHNAVHALCPWRFPTDARVAKEVMGQTDVPALGIPIVGPEGISFVLCAFQPRFDDAIVEPEMMFAVRRELEDALARIDAPYEAYELVDPNPAQRWGAVKSDPYATLELTG